MKKIIIAIDGLSGCGKSTTAKSVAKVLKYAYIDSGAMYRAVTLYFLNKHTNLSNIQEIRQSLESVNIDFHVDDKDGSQRIFLNGKDVEDEIRGMPVTDQVSEVSKIKEIRQALVAKQRQLGSKKGVVMDGRDIGTVVFPDAELKVFMSAKLEVRAARRLKELQGRGQHADLDQIRENLAKRDHLDSSRAESPLVKAADAVEIDTSDLQFEDQVARILELARDKMN
ncbi:MAG: (d)CMP kinase [Lunatimonas sp.]|uniref:(d)CMP kinase n=1 Tax=Lunatimonas sp. TaxID=2060141 RepID=UPI00263BE47F|nr:(d)CMP kinase [Lunatimonas sp.]MCC5936101.1 (d)CMP kinase [Lunatimonas sp.]